MIVSSIHKTLNPEIWKPEWFGNKFGNITNDLVNCLTGAVIQGHEMKDFWDGFSDMSSKSYFQFRNGEMAFSFS